MKCKTDGTFKMLMISDQHYTAEPDTCGIEKPDLVVAIGDCLTGDRSFTVADVEKAIANAAASQPVFNLWLVDSGDQTRDREDCYDWIHTDQVH